MFKFLHAADLHLDSPLRGLEQYEGAPVEELRTAPRRALANLVDTALAESVAFVLIAGDLYDGDWPDYNTGLYFVQQMARLREAAIPVYLIAGNHDAANRMTRSLRMPDHVHLFSADAPETKLVDGLPVAVHGQSYATAAVFADMSIDYPRARPDCWNVGLLHTSATGRQGHERYAPCTVDGLKRKGYDYWALGHVHQRETLSLDPFIGFPGNIQGRHAREVGAKGCLMVSVADDRRVDVTFRPLDVVRWEAATIDVAAAGDSDEVLDAVAAEIARLQTQAAGRTLALRIELIGSTPAHRALHSDLVRLTNEIRATSLHVAQGAVWIEKVKLRTTDASHRSATRPMPDGALSELESLFANVLTAPEGLAGCGVDFSDVIRKLPPELKELVPGDDPQWRGEVVRRAESLLMSRLLPGEGSE